MPSDTDRIRLRGIRAKGFHGVLDSERRDGQVFVVDVDLDVFSLARAAQSDMLSDTVDYGAVATAVAEIIKGPAVNLIETLAERIATACLGFQGVKSVEVTVHKPNAPIPVPFEDVMVTVWRTL